MQLTDTHTHLYASEFDEDRTAVIQNAIDNNISRLFLPSIDSNSISGLLALTKQFPSNCFAMMGLHPCSVKENYIEELQIIEQILLKKECHFYAIGEIGIDLYWDKTFLEQQKDAFRKQIMWAKQHQLPIIIHTRNSFEETYNIVKEFNDDTLKGIFHCFSGTIGDAHKIIDLGGFKLGIGGVITFKNSGLDTIVKAIDLSHIVLETDAPYLSPVPHRGKRNESSYLLYVAQKIAEIKNTSIEEVAEITTHNSREVFGI